MHFPDWCAILSKLTLSSTHHPGVAQLVARLTGGQEAVSSSLATRTILTKRYRCVWRKARRINRFRAFSGPDFFFQTIDANRCFRASAPIRTGRFPFSGRYIQPAPFLSGNFSGWQRYFSQKRITKIWASFCWSCQANGTAPFFISKRALVAAPVFVGRNMIVPALFF